MKPDGTLLEKDSNNNYVDADKQPLSKDSHGNYVFSDGTPKRLPTDSTGKFIYPIVREDGSLLPTDASTNRHLTDEGLPIATNDYGQPSDQFGNTLPVDDKGRFIYKTSAEIRPTDSRTGRPVTVVGEDGQPLPTDSGKQIIVCLIT